MILIGVRNADLATNLGAALAENTTVLWPGSPAPVLGNFHRGIMTFEPATDIERRWYHKVFKTKIVSEGTITFLDY